MAARSTKSERLKKASIFWISGTTVDFVKASTRGSPELKRALKKAGLVASAAGDHHHCRPSS